MREFSQDARKLLSYSVAMLGPVASAGVQFALSLVLLRRLETDAFGRFSFLLIASQFSWGIWGALFCAPLPVVMASAQSPQRDARMTSLFATNYAGACGALIVFFVVGRAMQLGWAAAAFFAAFSSLSLMRWFARTYAYATGRQSRAAASDLIYSGTLALAVPLIALRGDPTLNLTWGIFFLAVSAGFCAFDGDFLKSQFRKIELVSVRQYGEIWRMHARWSLLGVFSTEATANSHAYIVTLFGGTAAFAPLAASALLVRPVTVAMNALTEFERSRMAHQLSAGKIDRALASASFFRWALVAVWVATAAATVLLMRFRPGLVFPARYSLNFLSIGAALWMVVAAVRLLRMPESCLLQAAGEFRPLAFASVWSSGVSVIAVSVIMFAGGPLWSIIGVFIGEGVFAAWIWRQTRQWLRQTRVALAV